ncbi:MAG: hypothetical protein Q7R79_04625, partial [bacterium]|nr:hypothetical protein [bacterium]
MKTFLRAFARPFTCIRGSISYSWNRNIRRWGKYLQVPIVTYCHKTTGKIVVLVGMIHVAEPWYYKGIQDLVDGLERAGYQILYERVKK